MNRRNFLKKLSKNATLAIGCFLAGKLPSKPKPGLTQEMKVGDETIVTFWESGSNSMTTTIYAFDGKKYHIIKQNTEFA